MSERALPVAYPFVLPQQFTSRYSDEDAIMRGTLFPELDLPFTDFQNTEPLPKTPLNEQMTLDFVRLELRLYLDTHPDDTVAAELLQQYDQQAQARSTCDSWVFSPWPWEGDV
ncbi:MAG: spore coat associated protein CotJA [Defluviitaleaceae bacterium]|nr:spore coat associated protein CotJA [Defluviitaleaceae bacterium]